MGCGFLALIEALSGAVLTNCLHDKTLGREAAKNHEALRQDHLLAEMADTRRLEAETDHDQKFVWERLEAVLKRAPRPGEVGLSHPGSETAVDGSLLQLTEAPSFRVISGK